MKLDVSIIAEAIKPLLTHNKMQYEISFNISGIRRYSEEQKTFSESIIYVMDEKQFCGIDPLKIRHVIVLSDDEIDSSAPLMTLIQVPCQTNPDDIVMKVQDMFDYFHAWEADITEKIFQKKPLQEIFDLACTNLTNPIALFDSGSSLLMVSGNIPLRATGSIWDEILTKGYSPKEDDEIFLKKQLEKGVPFHFRSSDIYKNHDRLIAPIRYRKTLIGILGMTDIYTPFTKSERANLFIVQHFMQNAFSVSEEFQSYLSETPWYLSQLLQQKSVEPSLVKYHLSTNKKESSDSFRVFVVHTENSGTLNELTAVTRKIAPDAIIFIYRDQIVACDYDIDHWHNEEFIRKLDGIAVLTDAVIGYSMVFYDFFELFLAYQQSMIALQERKNNDKKLMGFSDNVSNHILRCLNQNTHMQALVYPKLRKLFKKDEYYARELLTFFMTFLFRGGNLSATAADLFIHRHTAIYRIESIKELTGIELSNLTDNDMFHLYISCMILLESQNKFADKQSNTSVDPSV